MTRASRQRQRRARARAARMQAVVVDDNVGRGPLSQDERIRTVVVDRRGPLSQDERIQTVVVDRRGPLSQDERIRTVVVDRRGPLSQDEADHLLAILRSAPAATDEEIELMQAMDIFDNLLDNPCVTDVERNELLNQRAAIEDQLQLLFAQNEEWQQWRSQQEDQYLQSNEDYLPQSHEDRELGFTEQEIDEQFDDISQYSEYIPQSHEDYLRELGFTEQEIEEQFDDISEYSEYIPQSHEDYLRELGLTEQEIEERIREIPEFEVLQQGERQSVATEQRLTQMSSRPVDRPSNQHQSSKGHILNPNQVVGADDSPKTLSTSPGSPTSILSADFGDDDVLPIEETSCVICHVDYRHGDDVSRNANCYRNANTHGSRSTSTVATCNHVFHTDCITSWIEGSGKSDCPCCRRPFALTVPT